LAEKDIEERVTENARAQNTTDVTVDLLANECVEEQPDVPTSVFSKQD
jgi:hypothetical protein